MKTVEKQISALKTALASPAEMPENMKASMQKKLDELRAKEKPKESVPEPEKAKEKPKVEKEKKKRGRPAKKAAVPKNKRIKETPKSVVIDGKEISSSDADYCEKLLAAWAGRREKAIESAKKHKTKSVFERITDKVEQAVTQAIKTIPAKEIAANPKKHIEAFQRLEMSMEEFLNDFHKVMGDEYDSKDVKDAIYGIRELIEGLKKKFNKKMAKGGSIKEEFLSKNKVEGYTEVEEDGGGKKKRGGSLAWKESTKKWREHLASFRKDNPELSLKDAMKAAKLTYKK